jgi:demethylmenaquinone methyltransferase/2-methoxy-6-polyprenyl-1,4-benzoquinol methylase
MTEPAAGAVNAASFDATHDDVFSRIAARYDILCDLFSLGIHRRWKRRVAQRILAAPWQTMLDVAAGTGHISLRVIRGLDPAQDRTCVVSDICPQMLAIAQRRAGTPTPAVEFRTLDAHHLASVPSESVDLYSISLGLKICDRHQVLREAWRVLRPGGTFISLEASEIPVAAVQRAYLAYMSVCMPIVGWAATGGDASAYHYLLKGVRGFPGAEDFAREVATQGFVDIVFERMSFGIVAIHVARKPR